MQHQRQHEQPARPPQARAHEDAGPFDWLVPFIPPVLRVNRETREALWTYLNQFTIERLAVIVKEQIATWKPHWKKILLWMAVIVLWIYGLVWADQNANEFAVTYVIISGFGVLVYHLFSGDGQKAKDELSAYSVFNKGGQRMLGSLSAEQFENEIRHRHPHDQDWDNRAINNNELVNRDQIADGDDEDDVDMRLALQLSLQEKKREERRARRTRRR